MTENTWQKGDRVRLVSTTDEYTRLRPGDTGTVAGTDPTGTVLVDWDNGSHLGMLPGTDVIAHEDRCPECRRTYAEGHQPGCDYDDSDPGPQPWSSASYWGNGEPDYGEPDPADGYGGPSSDTRDRERHDVRYPDVAVQLTGQDGNAFAILGRVRSALRKAGVGDMVTAEFMTEATSADYDHLLQTVMRWVNVE